MVTLEAYNWDIFIKAKLENHYSGISDEGLSKYMHPITLKGYSQAICQVGSILVDLFIHSSGPFGQVDLSFSWGGGGGGGGVSSEPREPPWLQPCSLKRILPILTACPILLTF